MTDEQKYEMAGRMYECTDIRQAIENGEFENIGQVLAYVRKSAAEIEDLFRGERVFDGFRILTKGEFEDRRRQVEQHRVLAELDHSVATPQ